MPFATRVLEAKLRFVAVLALIAVLGACDAESACQIDGDCTSGEVCERVSGACVACLRASDCAAGQLCRANACEAAVPCVSSRICDGLVCNLDRGVCVDCVSDADCVGEERCSADGTCGPPPPPCTSDRECADVRGVCDTERLECVECVSDADCLEGGSCEGFRCEPGEPQDGGVDGGGDAAILDGAIPDAGVPEDAGPDAGRFDAGASDGGAGDAGFTDAGFTDAGFTDAGIDGGPGCVSTAETCNGLDDDCNGVADDALTPPQCALVAGVCAGRTETCGGSAGWLACGDYGSDFEATESSCDGLDNDCDGDTDELLTGPACALTMGVCEGSTQACGGIGGFAACDPARYGSDYEAEESSCDGLDNDCDGTPDEGCGCSVPAAGDACGAAEICACPGLASSCSGTGMCRARFGDYAIVVASGTLPSLDPAGEPWDIDFSAPEPYVRVFVGDTAIGTTSLPAPSTYTPVWNTSFLSSLSDGAVVRFEVFDEDFFADDDAFVCELTIDAAALDARSFMCAAGPSQIVRGRFAPVP